MNNQKLESESERTEKEKAETGSLSSRDWLNNGVLNQFNEVWGKQ